MLSCVRLPIYGNWIGKSPADVRKAVIACGGWEKVFPDSVPDWAHRLRNYFNVTPKKLQRLNGFTGYLSKKKMQFSGIGQFVVATYSLTEIVYRDEEDRIWYQIDENSIAYHFEGEVTLAKNLGGILKPQMVMPVFKLVSPDGTGGSSEICIDNKPAFERLKDAVPLKKSMIGKTGKLVDIESDIVTDPKYQGTYNYSESLAMGYFAHRLRDMKPHENTDQPYEVPPPNTTTETRGFPQRYQNGGPIDL